MIMRARMVLQVKALTPRHEGLIQSIENRWWVEEIIPPSCPLTPT